MVAFFAWVILLAPLGVAIWLCISPKTRRSPLAPKLAIASVLLCAVVSFVFWVTGAETAPGSSVTWMDLSGGIELGVIIDPLSTLMLLVVGFVGSAIFIFALGYMKGDPSIGRFYAKFALFVFSMLGIVLANNFLMMFVFWELVGASSYLLIGYYHEKPSAVDAGKKAFLTNRVADFGFLLGILMIWDLVDNRADARRCLAWLLMQDMNRHRGRLVVIEHDLQLAQPQLRGDHVGQHAGDAATVNGPGNGRIGTVQAQPGSRSESVTRAVLHEGPLAAGCRVHEIDDLMACQIRRRVGPPACLKVFRRRA